jgi:hypothetical protein
MLEAMAALILALVGALLIIAILAYGIYVTFYPLHNAVKGGMEAMKVQAAETAEKRLLGEKMPEPTMAKYA